MLYTRSGDDGSTNLYGSKKRFKKSDAVFDALGNVDELSSFLGLLRAKCKTKTEKKYVLQIILEIQENLFIVQAELAGANKTLSQKNINKLEKAIKSFEEKIENPHSFVIPGETELSALFDLARTISRKAERSVLKIEKDRRVSRETLSYLNRLSSFFYAVARLEALDDKNIELRPSY
jgi:cob(I)alamin adenosyltransferase